MVMHRKEKYSYNLDEYNFRQEIEKMFGTNQLERIHEIEDCDFGILDMETDQTTYLHKKFYEKVEQTNFLDDYKKFLKDVILPHFNEDLLYQKIPTFRIQVPDNISVAEFHNDKSYSHSPDEVNIFLPITEAKETYTIWSESQENLADYSPMNAEYGEYYIWDGANLKHGNKINESNISRFSVDFRVLPFSKYDENNMQETITTKIKLKLGSYFELMEVNK
jgi:ectoine hydroxylase-related dioxygenase (phytanoyl-CoA dioxygenase family)